MANPSPSSDFPAGTGIWLGFPQGPPIPGTYRGVTGKAFFLIMNVCTSSLNGTIYSLQSAPSAPLGYAWSNSGADLSMELASPGTFTLNSVALYGDSTLWGSSSEPATIEGWLSGLLVDTLVTPILDTLTRGTFTTFTLNWSNIDTVTFSTSPATHFGQNLLLTDFTINEPVNAVPIPATLPLFVSGLAGLGWLSRRKRKQAA